MIAPLNDGKYHSLSLDLRYLLKSNSGVPGPLF
jgi:hypothetical protein